MLIIQISEKYRNAEVKNELYSRWSRKSLVELNRLQGQWDHLERTLEEHKDIVSRQVIEMFPVSQFSAHPCGNMVRVKATTVKL